MAQSTGKKKTASKATKAIKAGVTAAAVAKNVVDGSLKGVSGSVQYGTPGGRLQVGGNVSYRRGGQPSGKRPMQAAVAADFDRPHGDLPKMSVKVGGVTVTFTNPESLNGPHDLMERTGPSDQWRLTATSGDIAETLAHLSRNLRRGHTATEYDIRPS